MFTLPEILAGIPYFLKREIDPNEVSGGKKRRVAAPSHMCEVLLERHSLGKVLVVLTFNVRFRLDNLSHCSLLCFTIPF